jgi:hypothetical protein
MPKIIKLNEKSFCIVGKNKIENWKLLEESKENKENNHYIFFFHLTHFPSCYVFLYTQNDSKELKKELEKEIIEASIICKNHTKYKNLRNLSVDYTDINNIIKGEEIGEVIYISNKKVYRMIL